jgi:Domain of unknown function (DUF3416)
MKNASKSHAGGKNARSVTLPEMARCRVVIEGVKPEINGGRFAAKRAIGERMTVEADIFADGHDAVAAVLLYRREQTPRWTETLMTPLVNDRWRATFEVNETGTYFYTLQGWVDRFESWHQALVKKIDAEQEVALDLLSGAELVELAAKSAGGEDRKRLADFAAALSAARRVLAHGTSYFRAPAPAARTAPSATVRIACLTLPAWVSMFSIFRPSTRSAVHSAKGKTTPWLLIPRTWEVRGPSAPKRAATKPFMRSWDRWTISSGS